MPHQPVAYLYSDFLESAEARPIRILSEYLEPLRRFKQQKIQDTVVFFGSARIDSRERAERALATLRARGVRSADELYQAELWGVDPLAVAKREGIRQDILAALEFLRLLRGS